VGFSPYSSFRINFHLTTLTKVTRSRNGTIYWVVNTLISYFDQDLTAETW